MMSIASRCGFRPVIRPLLAAWLGLAGPLLTAADVALADSYRIQPSDIIIVDVVNERDLSREFRVFANGEISYPFLGALKVAGMTTVEVQTRLKSLLEADYLVNAQVIVQIKEFRRRTVSVFGQVNRPGQVELPAEQRMTIIEAITTAGGFTRLAKTSDIQLTRPGRAEPMRFSQDDLRNPAKVVYLEPNDVVFVPESRF